MLASPPKLVLTALLTVLFAGRLSAQPISNAELTRRQTVQQERAQGRGAGAADVFTPPAASSGAVIILENESPCFPIQGIEWRGAEAFPWISTEAKAYIGKCLGARGGALSRRL